MDAYCRHHLAGVVNDVGLGPDGDMYLVTRDGCVPCGHVQHGPESAEGPMLVLCSSHIQERSHQVHEAIPFGTIILASEAGCQDCGTQLAKQPSHLDDQVCPPPSLETHFYIGRSHGDNARVDPLPDGWPENVPEEDWGDEQDRQEAWASAFDLEEWSCRPRAQLQALHAELTRLLYGGYQDYLIVTRGRSAPFVVAGPNPAHQTFTVAELQAANANRLGPGDDAYRLRIFTSGAAKVVRTPHDLPKGIGDFYADGTEAT